MTSRTTATLAGMVSIILWSTTIAVARLVAESLGPLSAPAVVLTLAGTIGCLWLLTRQKGRAALKALPIGYLMACGLIFVVFEVCMYVAIGSAASRESVLVVTVINYLWPGMTLALSVIVLRKRWRRALPLGLGLAFGGVVLAVLPPSSDAWAHLRNSNSQDAMAYGLAFVGAVLWALFSNLTTRWSPPSSAGVPVFLLIGGLTLAVMAVSAGEHEHWRLSGRVLGAAVYTAVFPTLLAYNMWDLAMRRGNTSLAASAAHATPVLSLLVSWLVLGVTGGWSLWVACVLVVAGAVVCRKSIR